MMKTYSDIREAAKSGVPQVLAVVEAADGEVLKACYEAHVEGIADSILVGVKADILEAATRVGVPADSFDIVESSSPQESVAKAAGLVREGRAGMLMKGHLPTGVIMKGVLDKANGLRGSAVLSHTMVAQADRFGRFLLLSDAGLNPAPDADMLAEIIRNSVKVAHCLEISNPKVACLSAVEAPTEKIPSTLLCAEMKRRYDAGEFSGCAVDGPMALDLALYPPAIEAKGYGNREVAGFADILIVPEITSGNVLGKSFIYVGGFRCGGIIVGAKVPIVLLSRSDTSETKLDSIALACVYAQKHGA
ncbi:MAG: phosphate butyryltransferase [Planctomycetota bacterium]